jgi:lipoprotein-releasing system ATP-binding protein
MIELEHIQVSYGKREILRDINTTIATGCITAVMGPNGCGKTTLLRCIGGLLEPTAGSVAIDGKKVKDYSARALAQKVAFVRQQAQTDFEFSAFETVLMGRNPYKHHLQNESQADWDIVEQCMKQTNTWHLRLAKPAEMSGGEQQRVAVARALINSPSILFADEPSGNLDSVTRAELHQMFFTLRERYGTTIVIVTHDKDLAAMSDRALEMKDGLFV